MPVQGVNWSVAYSYGWSLVYGMVLTVMLALVGFMTARMIADPGGASTGGVVASLAFLAGSLIYIYKKFKTPYEYGWRDAEEHHSVPAYSRKCKPGEYCAALP
jgi:hypothetical protein